jgi:hypothetical protein
MYVERLTPTKGEKYYDLESLAQNKKTHVQYRYLTRLTKEDGYNAHEPYIPTMDLDGVGRHMSQLESYSVLIAKQVNGTETKEIVQHIAHRAIIHSTLLAQDIVQPLRVWDIAHPDISQVSSSYDLGTYLTDAPTIYLAERPTLSGFANELASAISPPRDYDADCYRAGRLAIGLGFLMSDDALYSQHIERETSKLRDELRLWDGHLPGDSDNPSI